MNIQWNKVTRLSQLVSIALFIGIFVLGFWLGMEYERNAIINAVKASMEGSL